LTAGPTAEIGGETYHIGDYISFKTYNTNLKLDTYVTQLMKKQCILKPKTENIWYNGI